MMYVYIFLILSNFSLKTCENNYLISEETLCKNFFTMDVLQEYQAPVNVLKSLQSLGVQYASEDAMLVQDLNLYLKRDLSRIVGHRALKQLLIQEQYTNFGLPTKYLVPVFDKNSVLDFKASYVISMIVPGKYAKHWDFNQIKQLLHFANNSGVVDFYYTNVKRDNDGKNWLIDTQLDRFNENPEYRASSHIMQNIYNKVLDYHLDEDSIQYLKNIIKRYE